jgi:shikimate dehydrogenase
LVEDLRFEPEGKDILVLGAGGAARAIVMYLGNGPKKISVFDVEKKRSLELKERYSKYFNKEKFNLVSNAEKVGDVLRDSALLINATPVGMKESDPSPVAKELLRPGLCVYDLVYNRPYTRLIRDANSMKAHAVSGIGMLLYQGAAAFEIWTGEKAPVAVMRRELQKALKAQNK